MPDMDSAAEGPAPEKQRAEGPAPQKPPHSVPRLGSATARIVRENDMMRAELPAVLLEVDGTSASLRTAADFPPNDLVKIRLQNAVQRFDKECRGKVRSVEPGPDGSRIVSVELLTRLAPLDVSLLKMGIVPPDDGQKLKWY